MHKESKPFGVRATNSFRQSFNESILKLSFFYGTILVTILLVSGIITFNEFSSRVGKRFAPQPTITIQLPDGSTISNKPPVILPGQPQQAPVQIYATQTPTQVTISPAAAPIANQISNQLREEQKRQQPTAAEIRADLIASLIFVNGILLLLASVASYWLARITLRPIRLAYEKQKRFLGDASHELRTPLSILQIELENELHGERDEQKIESAKSKLEEVKRMGKLVSDLLTLSRLDDEVTPKLRKASLISIDEFKGKIQQITKRLEPLAASHSVALDFKDEIRPSAAAGKATKQRLINIEDELLSHALTNLIQNAIFYNKKDGSVDVAVRMNGKKVKVTVTDTGVGISEHDLEHIFDRFYRADKSRTRSNVKSSGSGLGLSIARSTLMHLGGTLHFESEVGKGTVATIEFFTVAS